MSWVKLLLGAVGGAAVAGGGYVGWRKWLADEAEPAAAAPVPRAPEGPLASQAQFRTPADAAEIRGGFVDIGGVELTRLPLFDGRPEAKSAGISFARLTYAEAERALKRLGLRMPTSAELDRARALPSEHVRVLKPCTLVQTKDDESHMQSAAFASRHDGCVVAQLQVRELPDGAALVNAGKHWASDPQEKPGRITNHGWYDTEAVLGPMIQRKGGHHDKQYSDYSQTTIGARDVAEKRGAA